MAERHFLFLQGPHGAFFRRLGERLAADGHRVTRVNLNGGDRRDWPGGRDYRGTLADWPAHVAGLIEREGVTDLLLFGDCRPYHREVIEAAAGRGVRVAVLEEGYLRPDYMTLETGGVNGHSTIPRDPDWFRAQSAALPPEGPAPFVPSSFAYRARATVAHGLATLLGAWRFPHYRGHRALAPEAEAIGWGLRWAGRGLARRRTRAASAAFVGRPYFALPLQLGTDFQIRDHSPFADMLPALARAVGSFARAAPADHHLVVKRHPLDGSPTNWHAELRRLARDAGVGERVHYLPGRDTAWLLSEARGVVTVNSTAATLALARGVPVHAMGDAVYDLPGLTHQGDLDAFWTDPGRPDMALWDAWRRVVTARVLVAGGYGSDEGVAMLVEGTAARLLGRGGGSWD